MRTIVLRNPRHSFDKYTPINAVKNEHLDYLKYLHENSCERDKQNCIYTIKDSHIEYV